MRDKAKLCIIIGTRPEVIKMAPIIWECKENSLEYFVINTGQHYEHSMCELLFRELKLEKPKYHLKIELTSPERQVGSMIFEIQQILEYEDPDIVFVQGDTNSVLAGALAALKKKIKVAHIESGIRSFDYTMVEENNRIVTDHISTLLFAPTKIAVTNLLNEGIDKGKIFLTGNTIVDSIINCSKIAATRSTILTQLNLEKKKYILATAHRPENVDKKTNFLRILEGLQRVQKDFEMPVVFPVHHRSRERLKEYSVDNMKNLSFIPPLGFFDFLHIESNSKLIITDSGGIQEESCTLQVPCVTIRNNTERPETVQLGMNQLAGTDPQKILSCSQKAISSKISWVNPFGDGLAGKRIIKHYLDF